MSLPYVCPSECISSVCIYSPCIYAPRVKISDFANTLADVASQKLGYCDGVRSACLGSGRVGGKGDGQKGTKGEAEIGDPVRV